ncbi:MAG TPA: gamma carbonic anhydrase family protein, partial [Alcaligenes faecalis]|nr:gamma carbonic anhydrase family protein [Alcaligenes faecalis]
MPVYQLDQHAPQIDDSSFVAAEATLIGKVVLKEHSSVWPGAVIRGDNETITVGVGS